VRFESTGPPGRPTEVTAKEKLIHIVDSYADRHGRFIDRWESSPELGLELHPVLNGHVRELRTILDRFMGQETERPGEHQVTWEQIG
jgi:hypothetical protein